MDYKKLLEGLKEFNQVEVKVFVNYLNELQNAKDKQTQQPKNKWFGYFKAEQAIDLYKKVALDNLFIDGDTITLQFKGKVMPNYNYQAYKNRLLNVYPETLFDMQNVVQGDKFEFRKENGQVFYKHKLSSPFSDGEPNIIGTYCIIKNNRGHFIETLNKTEIEKMKNVAKTKNIWQQWYGEMVLKSVIKRACKRHFKDKFTNIETLDNENYDLELSETPFDLQVEITKCSTFDELNNFYKENKDSVEDEVTFMKLLGERKQELIQEQNGGKDGE